MIGGRIRSKRTDGELLWMEGEGAVVTGEAGGDVIRLEVRRVLEVVWGVGIVVVLVWVWVWVVVVVVVVVGGRERERLAEDEEEGTS